MLNGSNYYVLYLQILRFYLGRQIYLLTTFTGCHKMGLMKANIFQKLILGETGASWPPERVNCRPPRVCAQVTVNKLW